MSDDSLGGIDLALCRITCLKTRSIYALKFTSGILLLSTLAWKTDTDKLLLCLGSISISTLLGCSILFIIAILVASYKWSVLLPGVQYTRLLILSFIGHFYSVVLPGQVSGEIIKAYRLGKGHKYAEAVAASVLIDKLTGLIGLLAVAMGGLIASNHQVPTQVSLSVSLLILFLFISLFFIKIPFVHGICSTLLIKTADRWPRFDPFVLRVFRLFDAWRSYLSHPLNLIYVFFLGILFQLISVTLNILIAKNLGIEVVFADWCWIFGLVSLAVLLPISIGGIGVREGILAGTLSLQGVPVEKSIVLSLAVFSISLTGALIGGLLELFRGVTSASVDISKKT